MEEIKLNIKELESLFKKYTYTELVGLNGIFHYVFDYNMKDVRNVLEKEANKKFHEEDSFDHTYKAKYLTNKELDFLYETVSDADLCLSNTELIDVADERVRAYNLLLILDAEKDKRAINTSNGINKSFNMSPCELEDLFNKYSVADLKQIHKMLDVIYGYDVTPVEIAISKVNEEKYNELAKDFEVPVIPNKYSLMDVMKKNNELSNKELEFLYTLVSSHFDGILAGEGFSALDSYLEFLEVILCEIHNSLEKLKIKTNKKEA